MEAFGKNEKQGETQFIMEIDGFLNFPLAPLNVNIYFLRVFFEFHPVYDQTQCFDAINFYFINNFIISLLYTFNDHTFFQIHIN